MLDYLKFIIIWLVFMALLGAVTVLVPKIAAKLDKSREKYKEKNKDKPFSLRQSTYMTPISEEESQTEDGLEENKEDADHRHRTE